MPEQQTDTRKYEVSIRAYKDTLYRSAFAIQKERKSGLMQAVELSGAPSVSGFLALLAEDPQRCAALLKPVFDELKANRAPAMRRKHKVTMKDVMGKMREGAVSPEELEAALTRIRSEKAGG